MGNGIVNNKATPLVTFVTVGYKSPHLIRLLLSSLEKIRPEFSHEFIFVNNAPGDGTSEMVHEKFGWVQVIDAIKNEGFGAGNNLALKKMQGKYAMLLNPDIVLFKGELEKMVDFMERHPDIGITGPRLNNPDGSKQDSCYRFPGWLYPVYRRTVFGKTGWGRRADYFFTMKDIIKSDQASEVDALMGSALLIRKQVFEDIGLFDENFFMYLEEFDICRRAWKQNWRVVYYPMTQCVHYHKRGSRIVWPWEVLTHKLTREHIKSALYYFWKHRNSKNPHEHTRPVLENK